MIRVDSSDLERSSQRSGGSMWRNALGTLHIVTVELACSMVYVIHVCHSAVAEEGGRGRLAKGERAAG